MAQPGVLLVMAVHVGQGGGQESCVGGWRRRNHSAWRTVVWLVWEPVKGKRQVRSMNC